LTCIFLSVTCSADATQTCQILWIISNLCCEDTIRASWVFRRLNKHAITRKIILYSWSTLIHICMVGVSSGNSRDHISNNQIFIVVGMLLLLFYWCVSVWAVCRSNVDIRSGVPVRSCIGCNYRYAIVIIYLNCRSIVYILK